MRKSSGKTEFVIDKNTNDIVGLNLSSDYCSEHERGIEILKRTMGILGYHKLDSLNKTIDDVLNHGKDLDEKLANEIFDKDFKMTNGCNHAYVIDDGMDLVFTIDRYLDLENLKEDKNEKGVVYFKGSMPQKINFYTSPKKNSYYMEDGKSHFISPGKTKASIEHFIEKTHGFQSAWGESDFLIRARGAEERKVLENIIEDYKNNDLTFNIQNSSNPFSNGGLTLTKASSIDLKIKQDYVLKLFEAKEINDHLKKTNIVEILKNKGFNVWGIMAEWFNKNDKEDMLYFFNISPPRNICNGQQIHGWATLKDLVELSEGKGYFATSDKIDVYIDRAKERLIEEKNMIPSSKM